MRKLRIATRRSALALTQTRMVARAIVERTPGLEVEEVQIVTEGDRVQDRSLAAIGGKGLFIKELETALLDGRADLAIHSMKDLPADLAPGLVIACVPERESPWDLLVTRDGRGLADLPKGARVGTSSLRRQLQISGERADLVIEMLRGNVDTRLRKLAEGQFDAIVLAEAGVRRLGLTITAQRMQGSLVPAIAQGALALETRSDDAEVIGWVAALEHADTRLATIAERTVMRALGGSCTVPIGALATRAGEKLEMIGYYADQGRTARASASGPASDPEGLGNELAIKLRAALAAG